MAPKVHQDHYVILSLPETCTAGEVTRRHKVLSMQHHPDRGGDAEVMARINDARDVLANLTSREEYHRASGRPPPLGSRPLPSASSSASAFERTTFGPMPQTAPTTREPRARAPQFDFVAEFEELKREVTPPEEARPLKRAGARRARPAPPPSTRAEAGGAEPSAQAVAKKENDEWWESLVEGWDFDRVLTEEEKALVDPEIQAQWSKWFE